MEHKEMLEASTKELEEKLRALRKEVSELEQALKDRRSGRMRILLAQQHARNLLAQQSTNVYRGDESAVRHSADAQACMVQKHSGEIF